MGEINDQLKFLFCTYLLNKLEEKPVEQEQEIEGRLYKTWEVSAFNKETGEWETTTNHGYEYSPAPEDFPQVESARITPTRRNRLTRFGKMIMAYGDGQVDFRIIRDPRTLEQRIVPQQNLPMHRIILQMNAHYMPETTWW